MKVNTYPEQGEWVEIDTEGCWACNAAHEYVAFEACAALTQPHTTGRSAVILQNDKGELREVICILPGVYVCDIVTKAQADELLQAVN